MQKKNILIIGGNRFFGLHLAKSLLAKGHTVTLLNRGNIIPQLAGDLHQINCDRHDTQALSEATKGKTWDIVFDQVCYDYKTAKDACEIFNDKTPRYIFTSTMSVYDPKANVCEKDFQASQYTFTEHADAFKDYTNAKRQAEKAFLEYSKFSCVFARFPFVIGTDDYTGRLKFHIDRINTETPIKFPNLDAKLSFISSHDAGKGLEHIAFSDFEGAINLTANAITLKNFIALIEDKLGKKAILQQQGAKEDYSPYGIEKDWYMNNDLMRKQGYEIADISEWLHLCI